MPRRNRRDAPGRLHHIMNRGIAKRVVFPDRTAKRRFILLIACAVRRGELEVEALSVMDTHFHLLARSPEGRISYPLMRILNSYARYFNRRFRRDGPVFRGRYCSRPVPTHAYWRILVRYIAFHPVKAGLCRDPACYPYGSARLYVLRPAGSSWLARSAVEAHVAYCVGRDAGVRRVHLGTALAWFERGLALWDELEASGRLLPAHQRFPAAVRERIEALRAELEGD